MFIASLLISCDSLLDITPKGVIEEKDLLATTEGYNSALAGVYSLLSSNTLYGNSLAYGEIDLLAKYWVVDSYSPSEIYLFDQFDYKANEDLVAAWWTELYGVIGQANIIVESIQENGSQVSNPELIEGEALGLRAFAHFELFKLFGPVLVNESDFDRESIPYREKFNKDYVKAESARNVLGYIKRDLLRAKELFENDPIREFGGRHDGNPSVLFFNDLLYYRVSRMNYYATVGLLIRLEMYMKNYAKAYEYIDELLQEINAKTPDVDEDDYYYDEDDAGPKHIQFVDYSYNGLGGWDDAYKDYPFSSEFLFSIYVNKVADITKSVFGNQGYGSATYPITSVVYDLYGRLIYEGVPEGSSLDIRYMYWFGKPKQAGLYEMTKFLPPEARKQTIDGLTYDTYPYQSEVCIISLSEIYLSACECLLAENRNIEALQYLNELRSARRLSELDDSSASSDELFKQLMLEYRKEYLASGRLFHVYKRLFQPITSLRGKVYPASKEIYEIPYPIAESSYMDNK